MIEVDDTFSPKIIKIQANSIRLQKQIIDKLTDVLISIHPTHPQAEICEACRIIGIRIIVRSFE
jgi:hypothetical protein